MAYLSYKKRLEIERLKNLLEEKTKQYEKLEDLKVGLEKTSGAKSLASEALVGESDTQVKKKVELRNIQRKNKQIIDEIEKIKQELYEQGWKNPLDNTTIIDNHYKKKSKKVFAVGTGLLSIGLPMLAVGLGAGAKVGSLVAAGALLGTNPVGWIIAGGVVSGLGLAAIGYGAYKFYKWLKKSRDKKNKYNDSLIDKEIAVANQKMHKQLKKSLENITDKVRKEIVDKLEGKARLLTRAPTDKDRKDILKSLGLADNYIVKSYVDKIFVKGIRKKSNYEKQILHDELLKHLKENEKNINKIISGKGFAITKDDVERCKPSAGWNVAIGATLIVPPISLAIWGVKKFFARRRQRKYLKRIKGKPKKNFLDVVNKIESQKGDGEKRDLVKSTGYMFSSIFSSIRKGFEKLKPDTMLKFIGRGKFSVKQLDKQLENANEILNKGVTYLNNGAMDSWSGKMDDFNSSQIDKLEILSQRGLLKDRKGNKTFFEDIVAGKNAELAIDKLRAVGSKNIIKIDTKEELNVLINELAQDLTKLSEYGFDNSDNFRVCILDEFHFAQHGGRALIAANKQTTAKLDKAREIKARVLSLKKYLKDNDDDIDEKLKDELEHIVYIADEKLNQIAKTSENLLKERIDDEERFKNYAKYSRLYSQLAYSKESDILENMKSTFLSKLIYDDGLSPVINKHRLCQFINEDKSLLQKLTNQQDESLTVQKIESLLEEKEISGQLKQILNLKEVLSSFDEEKLVNLVNVDLELSQTNDLKSYMLKIEIMHNKYISYTKHSNIVEALRKGVNTDLETMEDFSLISDYSESPDIRYIYDKVKQLNVNNLSYDGLGWLDDLLKYSLDFKGLMGTLDPFKVGPISFMIGRLELGFNKFFNLNVPDFKMHIGKLRGILFDYNKCYLDFKSFINGFEFSKQEKDKIFKAIKDGNFKELTKIALDNDPKEMEGFLNGLGFRLSNLAGFGIKLGVDFKFPDFLNLNFKNMQGFGDYLQSNAKTIAGFKSSYLDFSNFINGFNFTKEEKDRIFKSIKNGNYNDLMKVALSKEPHEMESFLNGLGLRLSGLAGFGLKLGADFNFPDFLNFNFGEIKGFGNFLQSNSKELRQTFDKNKVLSQKITNYYKKHYEQNKGRYPGFDFGGFLSKFNLSFSMASRNILTNPKEIVDLLTSSAIELNLNEKECSELFGISMDLFKNLSIDFGKMKFPNQFSGLEGLFKDFSMKFGDFSNTLQVHLPKFAFNLNQVFNGSDKSVDEFIGLYRKHLKKSKRYSDSEIDKKVKAYHKRVKNSVRNIMFDPKGFFDAISFGALELNLDKSLSFDFINSGLNVFDGISLGIGKIPFPEGMGNIFGQLPSFLNNFSTQFKLHMPNIIFELGQFKQDQDKHIGNMVGIYRPGLSRKIKSKEKRKKQRQGKHYMPSFPDIDLRIKDLSLGYHLDLKHSMSNFFVNPFNFLNLNLQAASQLSDAKASKLIDSSCDYFEGFLDKISGFKFPAPFNIDMVLPGFSLDFDFKGMFDFIRNNKSLVIEMGGILDRFKFNLDRINTIYAKHKNSVETVFARMESLKMAHAKYGDRLNQDELTKWVADDISLDGPTIFELLQAIEEVGVLIDKVDDLDLDKLGPFKHVVEQSLSQACNFIKDVQSVSSEVHDEQAYDRLHNMVYNAALVNLQMQSKKVELEIASSELDTELDIGLVKGFVEKVFNLSDKLSLAYQVIGDLEDTNSLLLVQNKKAKQGAKLDFSKIDKNLSFILESIEDLEELHDDFNDVLSLKQQIEFGLKDDLGGKDEKIVSQLRGFFKQLDELQESTPYKLIQDRNNLSKNLEQNIGTLKSITTTISSSQEAKLNDLETSRESLLTSYRGKVRRTKKDDTVAKAKLKASKSR